MAYLQGEAYSRLLKALRPEIVAMLLNGRASSIAHKQRMALFHQHSEGAETQLFTTFALYFASQQISTRWSETHQVFRRSLLTMAPSTST
ncbi:MAG: hypothetical protein C4334_12470 [Pyrinomonas sp.]